MFGEIPLTRTCEDARIPSDLCACRVMKSAVVDFDNVDVLFNTAEVASNHINNLLVDHQKICASLRLKNIYDIKYLHAEYMSREDEKVSFQDYVVTFTLEPGDGFFEAIVRHSTLLGYKVQGNIARVNMYHNTSACVDDTFLKNYCYCKNQQQ